LSGGGSRCWGSGRGGNFNSLLVLIILLDECIVETDQPSKVERNTDLDGPFDFRLVGARLVLAPLRLLSHLANLGFEEWEGIAAVVRDGLCDGY
jgi:hypothetical protein